MELWKIYYQEKNNLNTMKQYYNNTTDQWYTEGDRITILGKDYLFSGIPTEQQLQDWGYQEYEEPQYETEEFQPIEDYSAEDIPEEDDRILLLEQRISELEEIINSAQS